MSDRTGATLIPTRHWRLMSKKAVQPIYVLVRVLRTPFCLVRRSSHTSPNVARHVSPRPCWLPCFYWLRTASRLVVSAARSKSHAHTYYGNSDATWGCIWRSSLDELVDLRCSELSPLLHGLDGSDKQGVTSSVYFFATARPSAITCRSDLASCEPRTKKRQIALRSLATRHMAQCDDKSSPPLFRVN